MAIKRINRNRKITVNLDGPEGNAFVLLGIARDVLNQTGLYDWDEVRNEATSGDYKHLVKTLQTYIGNFVDFETNQEDLLSEL